MQYQSVDRLQDFEFHDSYWTMDHCEGDQFVIWIENLNTHKGTAQNNTDSDMEVKRAKVTFKGFAVRTFEPGRAWKVDENGESYTDDPLIIYKEAEACDKWIAELQRGHTVYDLAHEENVYSIGASGDCPYFSVEFAFDTVTVEWDAYSKKAWYELHRQYKREITLATPMGDQKTEVHIVCHDEDV